MVHSQFSLSWDSHKSNICGGFCALQQNGEFVDMTLAAEGHFVKVHQVLMALSSPYIKDLITSAPCSHPIVFLNNVSQSTLTLLLEYIYTGEVLVPPGNLTSFMEAAKSLQIKGLESVQSEERSSNARMGFMSKEKEGSDIVTPRKRKSETPINEALNLPATARKISIKPQQTHTLTPTVSKLYDTDTNKEVENSFSGDFDTNDSDSAEAPPEPTKSAELGAKTTEPITMKCDVLKSRNYNVKSSNLQFTVSIRGSLQVILNRFMYNLQSTQSSGVKRWRCIDYRNNRCMAFLVTKGNVVLNRGNPHCHSFHDKKILAKIEKNSVYSALYELEAYQERERQKQNEEEGNPTIEYIGSDVSTELPDLSDNSKPIE